MVFFLLKLDQFCLRFDRFWVLFNNYRIWHLPVHQKFLPNVVLIELICNFTESIAYWILTTSKAKPSMLSYLQCDQLVEFEVAQFFTKVAQKVDTAVFTRIMTFFKKTKTQQLFGLLLQENLQKCLSKIARSDHTGYLLQSCMLNIKVKTKSLRGGGGNKNGRERERKDFRPGKTFFQLSRSVH